MRFSIRDLVIAMTLLSVYLAVLTSLWRTLYESETGAALFGSAIVLALVLWDTVVMAVVRVGNPEHRLTVWRPQAWVWHALLAAPALAMGVVGVRAQTAGLGFIALYVVLAAFCVHLFLCLKPLLSLSTRAVTHRGAPHPWSKHGVQVLDHPDGAFLSITGVASPPTRAVHVLLPNNRVEQVRALVRELAQHPERETNEAAPGRHDLPAANADT